MSTAPPRLHMGRKKIESESAQRNDAARMLSLATDIQIVVTGPKDDGVENDCSYPAKVHQKDKYRQETVVLVLGMIIHSRNIHR